MIRFQAAVLSPSVRRFSALAFAAILALGIVTLDRVLHFRSLERPAAAEASRNSTGTYSLITPGNPVVNGTTITPSWANNTLSDLSVEMTDSLSRSGKGGMLAPLRTTDGTVASPAHSFTNEPGSGLYRIGASDYGFSVGGVKTHEWTGTGETVTGTLNVTDLLTQTLSGTATTGAVNVFEPSLANGNMLQIRLGTAAANNASTLWSFTPNATAALSNGCLGIFGASASILCVDGNQKTTAAGALAVTGATTLTGGLTVGSGGVAADGAGLKHQSVTGCTTAAGAAATCTTLLTWATAFADTSYQPVCSCGTIGSGSPTLGSITVASAAAVSIVTVTLSGAASQCSSINCIAIHN